MSNDRIATLEEMLRSDPSDAFTRYALALELSAAGKRERAIGILESLRDEQPEYIPAHHQLGVLFEQAGKTKDAALAYTQGIDIAQKMGDIHAAKEMSDALDLLS